MTNSPKFIPPNAFYPAIRQSLPPPKFPSIRYYLIYNDHTFCIIMFWLHITCVNSQSRAKLSFVCIKDDLYTIQLIDTLIDSKVITLRFLTIYKHIFTLSMQGWSAYMFLHNRMLPLISGNLPNTHMVKTNNIIIR